MLATPNGFDARFDLPFDYPLEYAGDAVAIGHLVNACSGPRN